MNPGYISIYRNVPRVHFDGTLLDNDTFSCTRLIPVYMTIAIFCTSAFCHRNKLFFGVGVAVIAAY